MAFIGAFAGAALAFGLVWFAATLDPLTGQAVLAFVLVMALTGCGAVLGATLGDARRG